MQIPKKIEQLIDRRAKLARDLSTVDFELRTYCRLHGISITDEDSIRQAIIDKEEVPNERVETTSRFRNP